ncbi:MAG: hypothetical protein JXC85_04365 [Candidatus Aenigmarchaeota archaeon]|nr:hypothetical protein [Candidatus Aenigmarchaeota archaeon]
MTQVLTWEDTLLDYLRTSNEDEQVVNFVSKTILPQLTSRFDKIDWLELGPGPGTKTQLILEDIMGSAQAHLRSLRLIEPSVAWCDFIRRNTPEILNTIKIFEMSFNDYLYSESRLYDKWQPNFVTCFHVLYEYELIEEFLLYLKHQEQTGHRLLACIIVESEHSDFFKLRQKLIHFGQPQPSPAALQLRSSVSKLGLPAQEFEVNSQYFRISDIYEGLQWLLAFLFGCEKEALTKIPEKVRMEANEIIKQFLEKKQNQVLEVPDIAFVFAIG